MICFITFPLPLDSLLGAPGHAALLSGVRCGRQDQQDGRGRDGQRQRERERRGQRHPCGKDMSKTTEVK